MRAVLPEGRAPWACGRGRTGEGTWEKHPRLIALLAILHTSVPMLLMHSRSLSSSVLDCLPCLVHHQCILDAWEAAVNLPEELDPVTKDKEVWRWVAWISLVLYCCTFWSSSS